MRIKSYRTICLILAILVSLAGIYFENIQIGTLSAPTPVEPSSSRTLFVDAEFSDTPLCTTEMLRIHNITEIQRATGRYISKKRDLKISLDFLCSDIFSLYEGKFFTSSAATQIYIQCPDELVTNFIHKSDGKKRI